MATNKPMSSDCAIMRHDRCTDTGCRCDCHRPHTASRADPADALAPCLDREFFFAGHCGAVPFALDTIEELANRGLPAFYDASDRSLNAFEFKHGREWTYEAMHKALAATKAVQS